MNYTDHGIHSANVYHKQSSNKLGKKRAMP